MLAVGAHQKDAVALARTWLGDTGMVVAREDLALEGAFWAQLPGTFGFRPRKAPLRPSMSWLAIPPPSFP